MARTQPVFLKIDSVEQFELMRDMLAMQFDMENDCIFEEIVDRPNEVRHLATLSDDEIQADLNSRRLALNKRIDRLLSVVQLRNALSDIHAFAPE